MLKIGQFSSLTQVSIKALRHYDELGLLKPALVDKDSGYRYYSTKQVPVLHRLLALRDLGFPLDRIGRILNQGITAETLRGMLLLRETEQACRVQEEVGRLNRLKARLRLIEMEGSMAADVVLKELPPQWIVSVRHVIPNHRSIGALFTTLIRALEPDVPSGMGAVLWHDAEYRGEHVDVEAGIYLSAMAQVPNAVKVRQLPAVLAASIVHHGAFSRIAEAYQALLFWVEAGGYRPAGPCRQLFLHVNTPVDRDDDSNVTEIQVPLEQSAADGHPCLS